MISSREGKTVLVEKKEPGRFFLLTFPTEPRIKDIERDTSVDRHGSIC